MNWFERLCRNTGLMIHGVVRPESHGHEVRRQTQEKKVDGTVTLRRTVIEEIEVRQPGTSESRRDEQNEDDRSRGG
jgi:hypothetical protein